MYLRFFDLERRPFGITPDPRFLFLSTTHREALAALVYGVAQRKGFISITGEVGTGKTIVLRAFLERIESSRVKAFYFLNPLVSFEQIVDEILASDEPDGESGERLRRLQETLIEEYRSGRNVVLVFDEAQRMPAETLEKLRILSNLETSQEKLVQIVLAGQPELERKLAERGLRQLEQRIAVRARIGALNARESAEYVDHRMSVAKGSADEAFSRPALRRLIRNAKGNPRVLNTLCDNALLATYGCREKPVSWRTARAVIADRTTLGALQPLRLRRALSVTGVLMIGILVAMQSMRGGGQDARDELSASRLSADSSAAEAADASQLSAPPAGGRSSGPVDQEIDVRDVQSRLDEITVSVAPQQVEIRGPIEKQVHDDDLKLPARVVVEEGDGLWALCRGVYGFVNADVIRTVLAVNPQVVDPDSLEVGEALLFPLLPSDQLTAAR